MEYVLQTNAVKNNYGNYHALNGLTMRVPKGSIYGFVGKTARAKRRLFVLFADCNDRRTGK